MSDSAPETLFAQWIDSQARGDAHDFEAFCARHPEHADALRRLHRKLALVDRVFGAGAKELSRELAPASSWADQLEKIRRIGAAAERYARGDEIGHGGMGSVHQVVDHLLERSLAMKVLRSGEESSVSPTPASDDRSLGRFLEEALVTARLDHPYIVPVHDLGLDAEGRVYFAMKRVKGEDLRAVFEKIGMGVDGWTTTRGLQVILKVCEAMAYAHSKHVIHRDLKPGNVMVGPFGEVYVMDWGLARILDRPDTKDVRIQLAPDGETLRSARRERQADAATTPDGPLVTMDGDVVGTPSYMPLEQAEGELDAIGPRADVYAIGAMLYHLLAGRPPYVEDGEKVPPREILERVKTRAPRSLHELARTAPPELVAIVEKAMARRIEDRYADMSALAADLQAYLDVKVVSAYETGAIAELKKWVKRNPALAAAAAALVVVLAGATAVVARKNREVAAKNVALGKANDEISAQKATVESKNVDLAMANDEITAQKAEVESQKRAVEAKSAEVTARKAEFDQLSGVVLLADAIAKEADLYPAWPEKIAAMEEWLVRDAARLLELKPMVAATLLEIEKRSSKSGEDAAPSWQFASESDRFLHETLSKLATDIAAFESNAKAGVEQRLAWARRIGDLTLRHPNARVSWDEARAAILKADDVVASKLYTQSPGGPLDLKPQTGLVPIGMNPVTKLWEFYELRSSCDIAGGKDPATVEIPLHQENGAIKVAVGTGIVFVLLPGGRFLQGAQNKEEHAANYDPRAEPDEQPQEITLSPFFIARHEMTRAQWYRLSNGDEPSQIKRGHSWPNDPMVRWTHPLENVDWTICDALLRQNRLALPTEARWEYAVRSGTTTPWSTGREASSLFGTANVLDVRGEASRPDWGRQIGDFDDGFVGASAVGALRANEFGLFDIHGNVWEWCLDAYESPYSRARTGDGLRAEGAGVASYRVSRGGGFSNPASSARSATRLRSAPSFRSVNMGLRPCRDIDPIP